MQRTRKTLRVVATVAVALLFSVSLAKAETKHRVLLLPTDFDVLEWSASGISEVVPDWTADAEASLTKATRTVLEGNLQFELVELPDLTEDERALVTEHVALYKLTAFTAAQMLRLRGVWEEKRKNFDYSLGDGMRFLVERSGADMAVCVSGAQLKSSGGRVAMFILLAAAGIAIPLGGSQVTVGVVDLNSGEVGWMDELMGVKGDVRELQGANATMTALLGKYPKSRMLKIK